VCGELLHDRQRFVVLALGQAQLLALLPTPAHELLALCSRSKADEATLNQDMVKSIMKVGALV
jgi:hypothetical protein